MRQYVERASLSHWWELYCVEWNLPSVPRFEQLHNLHQRPPMCLVRASWRCWQQMPRSLAGVCLHQGDGWLLQQFQSVCWCGYLHTVQGHHSIGEWHQRHDQLHPVLLVQPEIRHGGPVQPQVRPWGARHGGGPILRRSRHVPPLLWLELHYLPGGDQLQMGRCGCGHCLVVRSVPAKLLRNAWWKIHCDDVPC